MEKNFTVKSDIRAVRKFAGLSEKEKNVKKNKHLKIIMFFHQFYF